MDIDDAVDVARIGAFVAVGAGEIGMRLRERKLAGPLRRIAEANGWSFTKDAPALAQRWVGDPFPRGTDRRATSAIRGTVDQRPFVAFNYTFDWEDGDFDHVTSYLSVVGLDMPVPLPPVDIRMTIGGVEQAVGMSRIEFENEDFNRRFRVSCDDHKLASDVLNPRAIEVLLAGKVVNARIGGGRAVAWAPGRLEVSEVLGWSRALVGVVDRIPDFVWKDHGQSGPGLTHGIAASSLGSLPLPPQESP